MIIVNIVYRPKISMKLFCRRSFKISDAAEQIAEKNDFEIKAYAFEAKKEDLRKPRIVRVYFATTIYFFHIQLINVRMMVNNRLVPFKIQLFFQQPILSIDNPKQFMRRSLKS